MRPSDERLSSKCSIAPIYDDVQRPDGSVSSTLAHRTGTLITVLVRVKTHEHVPVLLLKSRPHVSEANCFRVGHKTPPAGVGP